MGQQTNNNGIAATRLNEMIVSRRVLWIFTGILIVVFLIVVGSILFSRYQLRDNLARTDFNTTVSQYDDTLSSFLTEIDTALKLVGAEVRLLDSLDEQRAYMRGVARQFPEFNGIILTDAEGIIIADTRDEQPALSIDISDREYFAIHLEERQANIYLSPLVQTRTTGEWSIPLSWGIYDRDDTFLGIVATGIQPAYFASLFEGKSSFEGIVYDSRNQILTTIPFDEDAISLPVGEFASAQNVVENPQSNLSVITGDEYLTATAEIDSFGMAWRIRQQRATGLSSLYSEALLIISLGSALLFNVLGALWVQHRNAVRFIEQTEVIRLESRQRHLAENAVWKERNLLRTMIDAIPDYIFIKDREGRFIESNRAHTRATGMTYHDILNRRAEELFATPLAQQFQSDDKTVIDKGVTLINEERITVGSDGSQRWVLTTKLPLYDGDTINGLVGISRDITERRMAEEELRSNERRLRAIVSNLPAIVIEADRNGIITMMVGSALANTPFDAEELSQTALAHLYRTYIDEIDEILDDVRNGIERNTRMTIGNYVYDTYFIPHTDAGGEVNSIISVANDITVTLESERVHLEIARERDLLQLKERFIATASHDFRTPLSVIRTRADMIYNYHDRLTPEKRRSRLKDIMWQVDHMTSLLDNILRLSQANLSAVTVDKTEVPLALFSERVWQDMVETNPGHTKTDFCYDAETDSVLADEHLLQYALINLLSNAFKYTPDDESISFSVADDETHVYFTIKDNGIGIPEADIPNLFEPFFRASNSPADKGKGLGLSIVKAYVDLHNGSVMVTSTENQGTTVTISIPR